MPGTSKKPPELGELLRGRRQLGFDRIEHGLGIYREKARRASQGGKQESRKAEV
jgi:hypothetical protein